MTAPDETPDPVDATPDPVQEAIDAVAAAAAPPPELDDAVKALGAEADPDARRTQIDTLIWQLARHRVPVGAQHRYRDAVTTRKWISRGDWDAVAREARREAKAEQDAAEREAKAAAAGADASSAREPDMSWAKGIELPDGFTLPAGYDVTPGGVFATGDFGGQVTYAPLIPVEIYVDPDGDQAVRLAWRDGWRWVYRTVPRSTAKSGRRLVAELGNAAFPAVEADAKQVERWLARVEADNIDRIPRREFARHLGWQPDGTFVTSPGTPRTVEPHYREQGTYLAAHRPHGSLDGWRDAVGHAAAYPVVKAVICAGLGSALLRPLGVGSFTLDVAGRSTRGKTTAAQAGLSVWADPAQTGDAMFSWKTTMLAAEKRLNAVRGMFVVFDETRLIAANNPGFVAEMVFQIASGHGKPRDGGWPSNLPWEVIVCSTGEQPALSFGTDQGAAARVLTVVHPPFGTGGEASAAAAKAVRDGAAENYGVAGPEFTSRLCRNLAGTDGTVGLRERHAVLSASLRGDTDMSARRAPALATLALAGLLAREWGILPWDPPTRDEWLALFLAEDQAEDRGAAAMDVVRGYVAGNRDLFWSGPIEIDGRTVNRSMPTTGWAGRIVEVKGTSTVAILPQRLREVLSRAGYDLDAVIPSWREAGAVHETPSVRPPWQATRSLAGVKTRMVIFAPGQIELSATDGGDGDDA